MKEITIVAHSGIGRDRVKVGEEKHKIPTTFAEVKSGKFEGWDEAQTMDDAESSYVIRIQRSMRPSGGLTDEEKAVLAEFRAKKAGAKKKAAPKVRNRTREARESAATPATPAE